MRKGDLFLYADESGQVASYLAMEFYTTLATTMSSKQRKKELINETMRGAWAFIYESQQR